MGSLQSDLSDRSEAAEKVIHLLGRHLKGQVLDEEDCLEIKTAIGGLYLRPCGLSWSDRHGGD